MGGGLLRHPAARKLHTWATALLGGAGIFVSALLAWLASLPARDAPPPREAVFLLGGALGALLLGLGDDRFGMPPVVKLAGQSAAAAILLAAGAVPCLHLGPAGNVAVALVALVALMNAVNFLDNMNGVVAGLAAIAFAAIAWGSAERCAAGVAAAQLALAWGLCRVPAL